MVILGIDPGWRRVGFGIITDAPTPHAPRLLHTGIFTIQSKDQGRALLEIQRELMHIIKKFKPRILAIEKLYIHKNKSTALHVAQARGVILLTALQYKLAVKEYTPTEMKAALTGYGHAEKRAVAKMVRLILKTAALHIPDDASDALALALTARATPRMG